MTDGYVLHCYGPERYLHQVVASVTTIRRHDRRRSIALYAPQEHIDLLAVRGLDGLFDVLELLPPEHCSIVGFKHHLDRFMPFDRCLFVDADMIWCRDPDALWRQLSAFRFTATGLQKADFWFGGPKGAGILVDYFFDRRRRTMQRFGLTYLPRVQAGMMFASDRALCAGVCATAREFLSRRTETHFRSRLLEGRSEESCEWSLAMAMSRHDLPVFPWFQGQATPQFDFIPGFVDHDEDFETVRCRLYTHPGVQSLRGIPSDIWRDRVLRWVSRLPGRGDYMTITPYALHFGWLRHKKPYKEFALRTWSRLEHRKTVLTAEPALQRESA